MEDINYRILGERLCELPSDKLIPITGLDIPRPLPDIDSEQIVSVDEFKAGDQKTFRYGLGYFHLRFTGGERESKTTQRHKPEVDVIYSEAYEYSEPIRGLLLGTSLSGDGNALMPVIPKGMTEALEIDLPMVIEIIDKNDVRPLWLLKSGV